MASMVLPFIANFKTYTGFDITIPEPIEFKKKANEVQKRKSELRNLHIRLSSNLRQSIEIQYVKYASSYRVFELLSKMYFIMKPKRRLSRKIIRIYACNSFGAR